MVSGKRLYIAEQVASAMYNKGVRFGELNKSEEEIKVYDELIAKYGEREETKKSLSYVNKG